MTREEKHVRIQQRRARLIERAARLSEDHKSAEAVLKDLCRKTTEAIKLELRMVR